MGIEFEGWPKTPRLSNGGVTITEKIDGTNACVIIFPIDTVEAWGQDAIDHGGVAWVHDPVRADIQYLVGAQSRKRLIFPDADNAGFARWVQDNAAELVDLLGPGRHFGEWWGQGIQRRYGMDHKVFSLFNWHKWSKVAKDWDEWSERARGVNMTYVPALYIGKFSDVNIQNTLDFLRENGSVAAAEWGVTGQPAEGVVIRHRDLGGNLKAFVENDDVPKYFLQGPGSVIQDIEAR